MWTCMCVYLCKVYVYMYVNAQTFVSTATRRGHLVPWSFFTLFPYDRVTHWAQRETDGQQAPVILLPQHHYQTYIVLWMQLHMTTSYFLCSFLGFELRTTHLHSKPFYPLSLSTQDPSYSLYRKLLVYRPAFVYTHLTKRRGSDFLLFCCWRISVFQVDLELPK